MNVEPTIGLALLAGIVSFISPCVLPLVPAYIGYMSGHATNAAGQSSRNKFITFTHGLFFVLGFTVFFVGFGLLTAKASQELNQYGIDIPTIITRLGGVAVILFGLYVMKALDPVFRRGLQLAQTMKTNTGLAVGFTLLAGVILVAYYFWVFESPIGAVIFFSLTILAFYKPISKAQNLGEMWQNILISLQNALVTDTRKLEMQRSNSTYFSSLGMGIVFAAGWTPCIGPIYGSVLTLATDAAQDGESLARPAVLLTAYSLGLGMPFLATALALNQMTGVMKGLKRNMRKVEYASGSLLILIGVLILSGSLAEVTRRFSQEGELGELSVQLEECSIAAAQSRIRLSSWRECVADGQPKLADRVIFAANRPAPVTLAALDTTQINDLNALNNTPSVPDGNSPLFTADPNFDPTRVEVGLNEGQRAPEFTTLTLEGEEVSLSDYQGKVILLNFWATWCGPCQAEMPEFQIIYDEYKDRGFEVLAINYFETPEAIRDFLPTVNVNYPILLDENGLISEDLYQAGASNGLPINYVIDGNGIIIHREMGRLNGETLVEILNGLQTGG